MILNTLKYNQLLEAEGFTDEEIRRAIRLAQNFLAEEEVREQQERHLQAMQDHNRAM